MERARLARRFLSGVKEAAQSMQELYFYSWGLQFTGINAEPFPRTSNTSSLLLLEKKDQFKFFFLTCLLEVIMEFLFHKGEASICVVLHL